MPHPQFETVFASTDAQMRAAQRLRYDVFVDELGGDGALVDHTARLEQDRFDPFARHLLLLDLARGEAIETQVVGAYRLLDEAGARAAGSFYSQHEYDLTALRSSGRRLLELGRSCVRAEYRGGAAMMHLWRALATYVEAQNVDILFGVASFHGLDTSRLAPPLSLLHHRHLAPDDLRVSAHAPRYDMSTLAYDQIDRRSAMVMVPSLIKAYLRLGGFVGEGAYLDHAFNTTDVCLILDTARMNSRQRALYMSTRTL